MTSDSERIVDLYQRHAQDFDKDRPRNLYEKPWLDRFLALLEPGATILDISCGMAEPIASYLIEKGFTLTGADSSEAMIAMCKSRFPRNDWFVSDMRQLSLNRQFDGVLVWDSFFHLSPEDQYPMFPIFRKHAAPNAALMFTSGWGHGSAIGEYHGEPLYHGSLNPAEYRALLDENGFDVVAHVVQDPNCGYHTVWLAQLR